MKMYIILGIATLILLITIWPIGIVGLTAILIKGAYDATKRLIQFTVKTIFEEKKNVDLKYHNKQSEK